MALIKNGKKPVDNYRKSLKKLSKKINRTKLAKKSIERFSARLFSLLEMQDFDLIVAPGNSGLMMSEIVKLVYEQCNKKLPELLVIPVYRDGTEHNQRFEIKKVSEVLFVDDEIMTGTSAKECIKAIIRSFPQSSHINVTIVAENMFFEWHHRIPGVSVYFYPFARCIYGLNNNISHILSNRHFKKLSKYIPIYAEKKQVLAMLLSGKIKSKDNDGLWYFDETIEGKVIAVTDDYLTIKKQTIADILGHVKSGIEKYKDKKIEFVKC